MSIRFSSQNIDIEAIIGIVAELDEYFVPEAFPLIKNSFNSGHTVGALTDMNELVGFAIYEERPSNQIELTWMAVKLQYQRSKDHIGTNLLKECMLDSSKEYFLFTGTQDSVIPDTNFNAAKLINNYSFFQKNGFRVIKRRKDYFRKDNHAFLWKYNKTNNAIYSNSNLSEVGIVLRPILIGVAKDLNINQGIIGVCFNVEDSDPIFFAEKIKNSTPINKMMTQKYSISRWSKFVEEILSDNVHFLYRDIADNKLDELIHQPIREEFTGITDKVGVSCLPLSGNSILYFVVKDNPLILREILSIDIFKKIFCGFLYQILFYIRSTNFDLSALVFRLTSCLYNNTLYNYSNFQLSISKLLSHPMSRIFSSHIKAKTVRIVDTQRLLNQQEKELLRNIAGYNKLVIKSKVEGSLQEKLMYNVTLTPDNTNDGFDSIIKIASTSSAIKDLRGHKLLDNFFSDIGQYLPPHAEYWPTITNKSLNSDDIVITIPKLRGSSLSSHVENINLLAKEDTDINILLESIHELKNFLEKLSSKTTETKPISNIVFDNFFNDSNKAQKRQKKLKALARTLEISTQSKTIKISNGNQLNPFYFLDNFSVFSFKFPEVTAKNYKYGHGDFHAGNILIDTTKKSHGNKITTTVLDFDYVGNTPKHYDLATLEASIFLKLVSRGDDNFWRTYISPVVTDYFELSKGIEFLPTFRIYKVLSSLNDVDRNEPLYKSNLLVAYLRLFSSYTLKPSASEITLICLTCQLIIGKLISELYEH